MWKKVERPEDYSQEFLIFDDAQTRGHYILEKPHTYIKLINEAITQATNEEDEGSLSMMHLGLGLAYLSMGKPT